MKKKKTYQYANWTEEALKNAIKVLRESITVDNACRVLNISSRQTLYRIFETHGLLKPSEYLKYATKPELSKDEKKRVLSLYSDVANGPLSAGQIAELLKKPKSLIKDFLDESKVTHRNLPFTPEEKEEKLDSKLLEQVEEIREYQLKAKIASKDFEKTKEDANKWRSFQKSVGKPLFDLLEKYVPEYKVPKLVIPEKNTGNIACILALQDYHFGRLASLIEVWDATSPDDQAKALFDALDDLFPRLLAFGTPDRCLVTVGGDFVNSDNSQSKTTNGTAQDSFPGHAALMYKAFKILIWLIDRLRQVFRIVELIPTPGNHDRDTSVTLYMSACAWYRNCDDVVTNWDNFNVRPRQYRVYGNTLLAFMHGDASKKLNWPITIANEARQFWGKTKYTVLTTGHHHFRISQDLFGVQHNQVPSMASDDRWSFLNGYQSEKGFSILVIDEHKGYVAEIFSNHSVK